MNFLADGDAGQCGGQGLHQVPINASFNNLQMTTPIRMDMDDRSGGCVQTWSVAGSKVALDIGFFGDGDVGQCGNTGNLSAPPDVTLRLDTDSRPGGCLQNMRLRAVGHALDAFSLSGPAQTIVDAWRTSNR
jgi:hypothetical protein